MAKVLITSLGTGEKKDGTYKRANYEIEGSFYENEPFISKALAKHYGIDKIFIVGTSGSMWDEVYSVYGGSDSDKVLELYEKKETNTIKPEELEEVGGIIDKYISGSGSKCFLVSYGLNDDELWANFEQYLKMSEYINDGDEVYLDITHSFRSLAMMSLLMTQFIEQVRQKDIKVKGIFYGMFEYGSHNRGVTPVVNMSILSEIQEWTKAVGYLKYSGNATMLANLMNSEEIGIESQAQAAFEQFANSVSMGNISDLRKSVKILKNKLKTLEDSGNLLVKLLSKDIIYFINKLDKGKESEFELALAEWFYENKNYAMSYMILADCFVSRICELKDEDVLDYDNREKAKKVLKDLEDQNIRKLYQTVNFIRNSIAHNIKKGGNALDNIKQLPVHIGATKKFLTTFKLDD